MSSKNRATEDFLKESQRIFVDSHNSLCDLAEAHISDLARLINQQSHVIQIPKVNPKDESILYREAVSSTNQAIKQLEDKIVDSLVNILT